MSNLFIFLIILILEAEARAPKNDLPHRQKLIIDRIYNSTHYYEKLESIIGQYNDTRDSNVTNPLLVGFARHPYEYSVPAAEYLKGMKEMDAEINTNTTGNRSKRNIIQLYNMISCATGCDPLSYNNYGCYCGILGGGTPVNLIDRCCQAHDDCYDRSGTSFLGMYLLPYFWQCNYGYPRCDAANYHPWVKFFIGNAGRLCECDRRFAMCLSRYYCPRRKPACLS